VVSLPKATDRLLSIYLALSQYPTLAGRIRARMRRELFERGVVSPQAFEAEANEKAIQSQKREGVRDPLMEESAEGWDYRIKTIRDQMTDYYFSQHLPFELFEKLASEMLDERGASHPFSLLSVNPELASLEMVFEQARMIEALPQDKRARMEARLLELKVVLIRNLISDQLRYINIAKEWFTGSDLEDIYRRKIFYGRIGGKAAGMLLAARILQEVADPALRDSISTPDSYFIGSDLMYAFMALNDLVHWNDQKYKDEDEMHADYPAIVRDFQAGQFPVEILDRLQTLLVRIGKVPVIVRSSSLLEDNFGTSFAGKYESIFCPNQGTFKDNMRDFTRAIATIYATTLNPNALLYRRSKGLLDYDERMGILVQVVSGETFQHYFLPHAAGVAFSRNQYRWAPQIRREDGFVRLVWGLGTRAVDRVGNDFPRLVALSHPNLRPSSTADSIRRYSQQYVDLIDLETNTFKTLPVQEVLSADYPPLRYLAQIDQDGYFSSIRSLVLDGNPHQLILTFDDFLSRTPFPERMRTMLQTLEKHYGSPVDVEFTAHLTNLDQVKPDVAITIIQCRPQSHLLDVGNIQIPGDLKPEDVILATRFMVPQGFVTGIRYVLFVPPEGYFSLPTTEDRFELERCIGRINTALASQTFICVGPGRWGTTNPDLGVHINYSDIYNARALVELAGKDVGVAAPEPSLGTHFFQDLLEAQIYPLAVNLDEAEAVFNREFFYNTPNRLEEWVPADEKMSGSLRLINVNDYRPGHLMNLVMDDTQGQAKAYLVPLPKK